MALSHREALLLPMGSVLLDASTTEQKEEKQVHYIVTHEGIKHFQYNWYKTKYDCDPASHGIGIMATIYRNTQFMQLDVPVVELEEKSKKAAKFK